MIEKCFSENEINCMYDVVYTGINKSPTNEQLVELFYNKLPNNIKEIGIIYGLCDTEFKDMLYVWLKQTKKE